MTDNITKDSEILKYAIAAGIIDLGSIRTQYEECERPSPGRKEAQKKEP